MEKELKLQSTATHHMTHEQHEQKEALSQNLSFEFHKLFIHAVNGVNQGVIVACVV